MIIRLLGLCLAGIPLFAQVPEPGTTPDVREVPATIRQELQLAPFYQKHIDLEGLSILSSEKVSDAALKEAAWIVRNMLSANPQIYKTLVRKGARIVVMAHDEYTTDVPEHSHLTPREHWDRRARGLGGQVGSCGEENLLGFPNDPYESENLLIHEFAHTIHSHGLDDLIPDFDQTIKAAYAAAIENGLWEGTYAGSNAHEYWAEGVQSWFDNNRSDDAIHNHVDTRAELKQYDPTLASLCERVFGDGPWRYRKPHERPASERTHLTGYDPDKAPTFRWRDSSDEDS
jgi:hypothetical protein